MNIKQYIKKNRIIRRLYYLVSLKRLIHLPVLLSKISRTRKEHRILVIGDSHTHFFEGASDFKLSEKFDCIVPMNINMPVGYPLEKIFTIVHVGPGLAYNTISDDSNVDTLYKTKKILQLYGKNKWGGGGYSDLLLWRN